MPAQEQIDEDRITSTLRSGFGDSVAGVASFDKESHEVLYQDDDLPSEYTSETITELLEHIQLELLNTSLYETYHDQTHHATVRFYDDVVTVAAPVTTTDGVVVALHRDSADDIAEVVDRIERMVQ
jgi:Mg2+ and Co2+ transporter CorA